MASLKAAEASEVAPGWSGQSSTGARVKLTRLLMIIAVVAPVLVLDHFGVLLPVNNLISEHRMAHAQRPVSGAIVHLGIDKKSLDRIGVWPWPRQLHAQIIEMLVEHDVADIALDIDFSVASAPEADRALAAALQAAGGSVILPAFVQIMSADPREQGAGYTLPLPMFREHAWLGGANVIADPDGVVRRFRTGYLVAGSEIPSLPALLAGHAAPTGKGLAINFALAVDSVPAYSVIDLLEGRIGADELAGRSVVVGAHAVELGDYFTVPVHGIVPGPLLQILAAETIAQDIIPVTFDGRMLLLGVALLMLASLHRPSVPLPRKLVAVGLAGAALELAGLLLQAHFSVVLPTAGVHLALLAFAFVLALDELGLRHWLLRRASAAASNTQLVLSGIIHDSSDAILVIDEDGSALETSRYARELFGPQPQGPTGQLSLAVPDVMAREARDSITALRAGRWEAHGAREIAVRLGGDERRLQYTITPSRLRHARSQFRRADDEIIVACITARDVTERRRHEARLDYLARFDQATGAMRRSEFVSRLEAAMTGWAEAGKMGAVFALSLHRFDAVTSMLGRGIGDLILAAVVQRLDSCDPRLSGVARLDGETFALCTRAGTDHREARQIAGELSQILRKPFLVDGTTARIGAHIGVAFADAGERHRASAILHNAEAALDAAREAGANAVRHYDPAPSARQERARAIERELWTALERQEMHLVYQPQVRLSDRRVLGAEALVRWRHPVLGNVAPTEFIPIAEGDGFIGELGHWVLETAAHDAARWPDDLFVAVNVSPAQSATDLSAGLRRVLQQTGLPAHRLQLEMTESSFLSPSADFEASLAEIRALGVCLALDDFGTGYSSLGYLARFPFDKIKLDRLFVRRIGAEHVSQAILRSVRMLTGELGLPLLCEGIENEEELAFLRASGCEQGQGYLLGKPSTEAEFLKSAGATRVDGALPSAPCR